MDVKHHIHQLKWRHKFVALGVVAAAMVATPLVHVLRYQSAEIEAALYAQAGLDPVASAVMLQHALLAHRDIAGLVLRGVLKLEPERTLRQLEVGDRAAHLESALRILKLPRAVGEAQALRQDWVTLVPQVEQRKILPADSDAAHRLLVEQTLQVIDLVADASGLELHGPGRTTLASVRELAALPRMTAQIAALGLPADSGVERGDLMAAEAALARILGLLSEGLSSGALIDAELASALATAGVTADRLFNLRRLGDAAGAPADTTAIRVATAAALRAQARLFDAASQSVRHALRARAEQVEAQRAELLALVAGLALLALCLGVALRGHGSPRPTDRRRAGVGSGDDGDGQALHRDVSGRLWQRLRQDSPGADAQPPASGAQADAALKVPSKNGP